MSYERSNFDFTSLARDGGRNPDNFYRHECHPLGSLYEAESGCTPDFDAMTDPEHLMRVFGLQQEFGEMAAGPDGVHYRDLGRTEVAAAMRDLSRRLREATWEPGPARTTSISKKSGNGTWPLRLRSVFTAVVSKVLHDTMQSFWDNRLLDGCCAYRPGRGPHRMLAEMLWTMKTTDCWVVAQADIQDAFENVAVEEVMRLHRELLTCDRLIGVIETLLRTDIERQRERTRGIDQGSAYSVHCLNARLHEIHDVHIRDDVPGWWRYSDDLTYLCATVSEGEETLHCVRELFRPTEFTLKDLQPDDGVPVSDLKQGDEVDLLGFRITLQNDRLRFVPGPTAWAGLRSGLQKAHESSDPPESALQCARGWIMSYGPAFVGEARRSILREVQCVMRDLGFRDCLSTGDLLERSSQAFRHWRSSIRRAKPSVLGLSGLADYRSALAGNTDQGERQVACPTSEYGGEGTPSHSGSFSNS